LEIQEKPTTCRQRGVDWERDLPGEELGFPTTACVMRGFVRPT